MQWSRNATRRTFLKSALLASAPLLAASAPHASAANSATGRDHRELALHPRAGLAARPRSHQPAEAPRHHARRVQPKARKPPAPNPRILKPSAACSAASPPGLKPNQATIPPKKHSAPATASGARLAIQYGCDPQSPDALNFGNNQQSLVDAAFLALAIVRAPNQLWAQLDSTTKDNLVRALVETRKVQPGFNNWLLFSAIIEAMFCKFGQPWDTVRIDYALRQHQEWYKGDGLYGDGPAFHWDYYNSFVIQPMLLNVLDCRRKPHTAGSIMRSAVEARASRYAAIQERLISPEGTFPAIGRSLAYRFGAFQHLAEIALRHQLPEGVHPAQVRCALTAVMIRMITAPGTFDDNGWLTIGFAGHQPSIGEAYISTGSLYLCSARLAAVGPARNRRILDRPRRALDPAKSLVRRRHPHRPRHRQRISCCSKTHPPPFSLRASSQISAACAFSFDRDVSNILFTACGSVL